MARNKAPAGAPIAPPTTTFDDLVDDPTPSADSTAPLPPLVHPAPQQGAPIKLQRTDDAEQPPKPARYRVTRGGQVMFRGDRVALRVGKVVDSRHYDVKHLLQQGVELQRIDDEEG